MIGTRDPQVENKPTLAQAVLFLALFDAIAIYAFVNLATGMHCIVFGPWRLEPTLGLAIGSFLVVGLPLLAMGLLRLHMRQGEMTGVFLDPLMAVFTPAMILSVLTQPAHLPGSTTLKWLVAATLLAASALATALLWNQVDDTAQRLWMPARTARSAYIALGCLCFAFLFVANSSNAIGTREYRVTAEPLPESASAEAILSNKDLWSRSEWDFLDYPEKLAVLAPLVSAECSRLNVAHPPALEAYSFREGLKGSYDPNRNTILFDVDTLDSGFEPSFETACHECAHAFQFACLEDPDIAQESIWLWQIDEHTLEQWNYEDLHYVSGHEDYGAYFMQDSELSARAWATHELEEFGGERATSR